MNPLVENPPESRQTLKRLLDALRLPVIIAERSLTSVLALILTNFTSALWLTFFSAQTFSLSYALLGFIFLLTALPALCFTKLFLSLREIIALPKKIIDFLQTSENKFSEYQQFQEKLRGQIQDKNLQLNDLNTARKGVTDLFALGKRLRDGFALSGKLKDVKSLLNESVELRNTALNAMLLANPLFIAITTLSLLSSCLWALAVLITLPVYWL
ncbi:hypothetical protein [Methylomicrobium lacus]|uniref:hypothetical protein n=1 Tax=Methylomicrobium lacus TaxID=136992 RepID=UPI00045E843E|nr:hypothetical protein [Methylomicrobium lacus]